MRDEASPGASGPPSRLHTMPARRRHHNPRVSPCPPCGARVSRAPATVGPRPAPAPRHPSPAARPPDSPRQRQRQFGSCSGSDRISDSGRISDSPSDDVPGSVPRHPSPDPRPPDSPRRRLGLLHRPARRVTFESGIRATGDRGPGTWCRRRPLQRYNDRLNARSTARTVHRPEHPRPGRHAASRMRSRSRRFSSMSVDLRTDSPGAVQRHALPTRNSRFTFHLSRFTSSPCAISARRGRAPSSPASPRRSGSPAGRPTGGRGR